MEDFTSSWDLIDIKLAKGTVTWSNNRTGDAHIMAKLDIFFIRNSLLNSALILSVGNTKTTERGG
jgi:hypothetical protein